MDKIGFAKDFEKNGAKFYIDMGLKAENIITKKTSLYIGETGD